VTTLCPGGTRTEFFARARMRTSRRWPMMDARKVAELGYRGLMRGKRVVIPGVTNKVASTLVKFAPTRWSANAVRKIHEQLGP